MQIKIDENHQNSRVDRFLREYFNAPQGIVAGVIRKGKIKINGKKAKIDSRLEIQDIVTVYHQFDDKDDESVTIPEHNLIEFKSWIIFENDDFFAINKPSGVSSQGGVRARLSVDIIAKGYNVEARITHRLDRETSGIMIIAKSKHSARHITELFAQGLVQKQYTAIATYSQNAKQEDTIISDIIKDTYAQKMVIQNGDSAITHYNIEKHNNDLSLINVYPKTGKMHQIRVHLASVGMPILGDEKYNGKPYQRMMLHASSIQFDNFHIACKPDEMFDIK
jgi:RluA family pseudouridine synthase